jgi:ubiquinone/menaquinone biosynthesis C-methylase UbiE
MDTRDAVALIGAAIPAGGAQVWADFGAGDGTFTRALVELLGPDGRVYSVDRDRTALSSIDDWSRSADANVISVVADLSRSFELPGLGHSLLDGALFANTLHFMSDAREVLGRLAARVRPGGRVVVVEYDRRGPSRWVPYPIAVAELPRLAESAGLSAPSVVTRRPSMYGGELYVAVAERGIHS